MKNEYNTISGIGEIIYEEKKSKFISRAKPVKNEKDAMNYINQIKELYRDATHNVYAYNIKDGMLLQRFSDDGEPSGTSGKPTLESINRLNVVNVVVVTTRYFGGTLLGTAGLIRAYGKSAQLAIEKAKIIKMVYRTKISIMLEYTFLGKVQNLINNMNYKIEKINYNVDVEVIVLVPKEDTNRFITKIVEETNDRILWQELGSLYVEE